jgi:hypothetical protein
MDVRLGVLFALALPLVLLIWAALRREKAILRLLDLYWKVASLWLVAVLLLSAGKAVAYPLLVLAPLLMVAALLSLPCPVAAARRSWAGAFNLRSG